MKRYKKPANPMWIKSKFSGECMRCHQHIPLGSRAFWWPKDRTIYCIECGLEAERDLVANKQDEDFMQSQFAGGRYE